MREGQRRSIAGPFGGLPSLLEEPPGLIDLGAEPPSDGDQHQTGGRAERVGLVVRGQLGIELAHPLPVALRSSGVAETGPNSGACVPAGRLQRLARCLGVLRDQGGVLIEAVWVELLQGARDRRVGAHARGGELQAVGDLPHQRMPEGVLRLGVKLRLEDELGIRKLAQRGVEFGLRQCDHLPQQPARELTPDYGRVLQHQLLAVGETIDSRRQHRLDRRWDFDLDPGMGEPEYARLPLEHPALGERADDLLAEERIAGRALADQA